ncbi:TetR/AcrR family transcriptional regulator [Streptomyces lycii]|uniref:TetR/AcrR family transcriptional regulator n=1 Tax=Streptomyces lycii TaxID=2654337 RepID=A0ABQ7FAB4_9ACTN|nr:TetR/AcrR family transcriptional regulator [Streptomyces lycii]
MGGVQTPSAQQTQPPLRRTPVQQRSAERLARILDACAEVLDETGYEGLSTRAVASRAGVPIGSVYRFFGNKRAMADALAHRNLDHYTEQVTERIAAADPLDWRHAIDVVLDVYIAMKRETPGFALVDFGVQAPGAGAPDQANHRVAERLCALLAERLGRTADARLRRTFLVGVEAADAVLQMAFRADPAGDAALIAETKELVRAYLARVLD